MFTLGSDLDEYSTAIAKDLAVLGFFLVTFGLCSRAVKVVYLSETLISTLFGIVLGSVGLDILRFISDPWESGEETKTARKEVLWFARVVVGVQVLFTGATLPGKIIIKPPVAISLFIILLPVMAIEWIVTGLLAWGLLPGLTFLEALLVGACCCPTDPVLASSVVKGIFAEKHCPSHIRTLLLSESGINDGLATPFVYIPLLIILKPSADEAVTTWVVSILFYDVLLSAVIGTAFGYALRKALKHARARECIDRESLLTFTVAIALFDIGFSVLAGTNEFLLCFFCGISLNWNDAIRSDDIHSHFSEGIEMVLDCAVFLILGTILPFDTWKGDGVLPLARLVGLGILVMLLRRLPWILLLSWFIPQIKTLKEAVFVGHFGPIGISSLYYCLRVTDELPPKHPARTKIIPVVTLLIFASVIVHGVSAPVTMLASQMPSQFTEKFFRPGDADQNATEEQVSGRETAESAESLETDRLLERHRQREYSPSIHLLRQQDASVLLGSDNEISREDLDRLVASSRQEEQSSSSDVEENGVEDGHRRSRPSRKGSRAEGRPYPGMGEEDSDGSSRSPRSERRRSRHGLRRVFGRIFTHLGNVESARNQPSNTPSVFLQSGEPTPPRSINNRTNDGRERDEQETEGGGEGEPARRPSKRRRKEGQDLTKLSIYDEGNAVIIDDGEGNVTVRKVVKQRRGSRSSLESQDHVTGDVRDH